MRKLLLTTAFALPLSMGAAFAQDATAPAEDPAMETAPMDGDAAAMDAENAAVAAAAGEKVVQQQAANELRVDWISDSTVNSPSGEAIGDINDLIVDGETGQMIAAIVGVGGFLGIGEKQIALPWEDLTINYDAQEITSSLTEEQADAAPEYAFRDREDEPSVAPAADATAPADATMPDADPAAAPADGTMPAETMPAETMETDAATDMTADPAEGEAMDAEPMEGEPMEGEPPANN